MSRLRWIRVARELPKSDTLVLVAGKDGSVFTAYSYDEQWCSTSDDDLDGITHWMPLPEPPAQEGRPA